MTTDDTKVAKDVTMELLTKLGFTETETEAVKDKAGEEELININIQASSEDTGMLIGFHGETLAALELVVSQIAFRKLGQWRRVVLNVGDYREKRAKALEEMARNTAQRVKLTGKSITLPYLLSSERRLVHLALSGDPEVETVSEGSGRGRRLTVNLKEKTTSDVPAHE